MFDISIFEPYIEEDNEMNDHMADIVIKNKGFVKWFYDHINYWCDCAYVTSDGRRLIQTNDKRYNYEITTVIHMIEKYAEHKDYFYEKLMCLHNANLEYEKLYGFQYDPHIAKKAKTSTRKLKQTSIDFGDKPKKETVAERKLKAHISKVSGFKITLKSVSNGE